MTVEFSMVEVNMLIEVTKVCQAAKKPVRRAKKLVLWAKLDTGTRGAEYSSNFLIVLSLSVIATAPSSGDNGTWSDRKLAAGKKLVGISVKMNKDGNSICKIRAR